MVTNPVQAQRRPSG